MANLNVQVSNVGAAGKSIQDFEASAKPLETNIMGINFDTDNDYTVPLKFGKDQTVFISPDQAETMKTIVKTALKNEQKNGNESVTVSIKGQQYTMGAADLAKQLP